MGSSAMTGLAALDEWSKPYYYIKSIIKLFMHTNIPPSAAA